MPINIMFGRPLENEGLSHLEYAIQLKEKLECSYDVVRRHHQRAFQRQKDHYDKKDHENLYTEGSLVWLHSPVVPSGQSQKFLFRVVRQLSEHTYKIQGTTGQKMRLVHFDRLKHYRQRQDPHPDTELTDTPLSHQPASDRENTTSNFGDYLQIVEDDQETAPVEREPRYHQRQRRPPDRLLEVVNTECGTHSS